ncbi:MAG: aldo/keto reductase [Cyanobacteria bacterium]|nr:aldo/keto reductase [Cyanobacteria bacterium CG_2015-22_32_23]NCQ04178.1 aldo/keto reductase [Cyanobacteria bacterium CG_2015-09_32_10]NCQ41725.1 aldo/keto reductase [Cyanobacteria bacterium CG_2015-04_32_10]NCS85949.1 aldo/keto reductase [Cyanobacteria bacterium CG_2015-02_32_10]
MQYRRFGKTELQMPVFSCGGMRYQYKWQDLPLKDIPPDNQENLEATIRKSVELGINHIETARFYGTSEIQLGQILPKFPRDKLIIQTKISPEEDSQIFRANFDKSLSYLNLDYVDLLGLHGINTPELFDASMRSGGCLDEAKKLQKEGKVRFIGFSTHAPTDLIIKTIQTNEFDYINLHWYWIYQNNWEAILEANRHDMGVFIISPSNKGGMLYQSPPKLVNLCQPLSPLVFNNLFCLSRPEVHTLSIGAQKPTDFDEHLNTLPLLGQGEELLPPIIHRLENEAKEVLGEEWLNTWQIGLPHHEKTPGNINIPMILWLRNLALVYDLVEYGKMRYNLLGNGGHWFPGQKADKLADFDLTNCLVNSPYKEIIPQLLAEAESLLGGEEVKRLSQS